MIYMRNRLSHKKRFSQSKCNYLVENMEERMFDEVMSCFAGRHSVTSVSSLPTPAVRGSV